MDKDELWSKTLAVLLDGVAPTDPKNFFLPQLHALGVFGDQFILLAGNEQVEGWVRMSYLDEISAAAQSVSGVAYTVQIASNPASDGQSTQSVVPAQIQTSQSAQPVLQQGYSVNLDPQTTAIQQPVASGQFAVPSFVEQESQIPAVSTSSQQTNGQPAFLNTYVQMSDLPGQAQNAAAQTAAPQNSPEQVQQAILQSRVGNEALFSKCTFETFVVGESNRFARGAALAVAEQPGSSYNPLFIYGKSGLGKTHLLVSIANYVQNNYPNMATRYVSANDFLNDYVEATQRNQWSSFNAKYHHVDILLIDDVQYLEGKDETINQLFNIFNEMYNQNKQVVLSADRAPKDINMDERLRSRFASGMLVDIKPPDYETRLAIIRNTYQRVQQNTTFTGLIPENVLNWLAQSAGTNIREMEGAITRLVGNMNLTHKPEISVDEAQEILQDFFPDMEDAKVTIATVQEEVEHYFKISHEDIISNKRSKSITQPRHIAIYLSRIMTNESLMNIGKKFGGRDHTTVMHSYKKIEEDMQNNRTLYDQLEELRARIIERS